MKRNDLMMEFALFVERNLNISIMTHRAVEDIAAHPQRIEEVGGCLVVYLYDAISFPIKCFSSDDSDYNRICAEELVELLNQKQ